MSLFGCVFVRIFVYLELRSDVAANVDHRRSNENKKLFCKYCFLPSFSFLCCIRFLLVNDIYMRRQIFQLVNIMSAFLHSHSDKSKTKRKGKEYTRSTRETKDEHNEKKERKREEGSGSKHTYFSLPHPHSAEQRNTIYKAN